MKKILYFEGAGCVPRSDVPNCRIRTAFHLDDGRALYLELTGLAVNKKVQKHLANFENAAFVDYCHFIKGVSDEGHQHHKAERSGTNFEYSMAEILKFVNSLGASFDAIEVLPTLAGYRVHAEKGGYNYGDEFPYDAELTAKRLAIHAEIYAMEKAELIEDKAKPRYERRFVHSPSGGVYPNFSLWVDDKDPEVLHLLRHFNGYNKHWTINAAADDWKETMTECKFGRYGC